MSIKARFCVQKWSRGLSSNGPEVVGGSEVQQEMTASSSRPLTSVRLVRALPLFFTYSPKEISDAEPVMLEAPAMIQRLVVHALSAEYKALVFPIICRTMEDNMDASTRPRGVDSLAQLLRSQKGGIILRRPSTHTNRTLVRLFSQSSFSSCICVWGPLTSISVRDYITHPTSG